MLPVFVWRQDFLLICRYSLNSYIVDTEICRDLIVHDTRSNVICVRKCFIFILTRKSNCLRFGLDL